MIGDGGREVPMKVLGYDGLKAVIVETLEAVGSWEKGKVTIMQVKSLTLREEVKYIPGEPEDENGPAIGWIELDGLSVALTRDSQGVLLVSMERAPGHPAVSPVHVRVGLMNNGGDLWEGDL
jgi:hypothetical protein